jgi:alpha-N-arabinofuranosidase
MIRTPESSWWSFPKKGGGISLQLRPDEITGTNQPSFLGFRITEPDCKASTGMIFSPTSPEECAGIAIERSSVACWSLVVENPGNGSQVSVYEGTNRLASHSIKPDSHTELRISMMFPKLDFAFKQSGADWKTITTCNAPAIATAPPGHFTGAMIGLYASSRGKQSDQKAIFSHFVFEPATRRP